MPFFSFFPKITYDLINDVNFSGKTVTNVFFRLKLIDAIKNNTLIYYPYYVKDNETMEDIAFKYYKDSSKHWIIALTNNIIDPFYDWPLSYNNFINYLINKYGSLENTYQTIVQYQMITTITNTNTNNLNENSIISVIDAATYANTAEYFSQTINLPDGTSATITTTTNILNAFDNEYQINEKKKQIQLISNDYVNQIEQEFETLAKSAK